MRWPWRREKREADDDYTAQAVARTYAAAWGTGASPVETAALEACAGAYARAFALADTAPAYDRETMGRIARDLIRCGESVHLIEVDAGGAVSLLPAASWYVEGAVEPGAWRYRLDLAGPSETRTRFVPAAQVVHCRYASDPQRPWRGVSPLGWARQSGRLAGELERALADEVGGPRGAVLPVPATATEEIEKLKAAIVGLDGQVALLETTADAFGEGRLAAPTSDYAQRRIGANPPATLATLRDSAARSVFAACGVPNGIFEAGAGGREAWRAFLHGALHPLAGLIEVELTRKIRATTITFQRLFASDITARARAFGTLTKGGMDIDRAARLAGLEEVA